MVLYDNQNALVDGLCITHGDTWAAYSDWTKNRQERICNACCDAVEALRSFLDTEPGKELSAFWEAVGRHHKNHAAFEKMTTAKKIGVVIGKLELARNAPDPRHQRLLIELQQTAMDEGQAAAAWTAARALRNPVGNSPGIALLAKDKEIGEHQVAVAIALRNGPEDYTKMLSIKLPNGSKRVPVTLKHVHRIVTHGNAVMVGYTAANPKSGGEEYLVAGLRSSSSRGSKPSTAAPLTAGPNDFFNGYNANGQLSIVAGKPPEVWIPTHDQGAAEQRMEVAFTPFKFNSSAKLSAKDAVIFKPDDSYTDGESVDKLTIGDDEGDPEPEEDPVVDGFCASEQFLVAGLKSGRALVFDREKGTFEGRLVDTALQQPRNPGDPDPPGARECAHFDRVSAVAMAPGEAAAEAGTKNPRGSIVWTADLSGNVRSCFGASVAVDPLAASACALGALAVLHTHGGGFRLSPADLRFPANDMAFSVVDAHRSKSGG